MNTETITPNTSLSSVGLVLEGGGLRGMFTNGILDVFMKNGIRFDAVVGVSAGVLFGCNYKSNQPGRALRYNLRYKDNIEYMSWKSLIKTGNYVNERFSYHLLPYMLDPFDFNEFKKNPMKYYAVCTDIERGCSVYHEIDDANGIGMRWMQASASMPVFAKPVEIDGRYYLDGGITDSIPLKFIQEKGFKKNIVILTQPADFRKKKAHVGLIMKLLLNRYPMVAELMARRHVMYNNELDYIHSELKKGDTFLICPDEKLDIGRLSMKEDKILRVYEAGEEKAQQLLPQIKDFISIKSKLVY
ncbi:patatin-like phospholipase family protein [Prevotella sp.]|uniref:patatin-like phospholipase family protein n=1 Tax=Prevotella sp. TaxID=59823 RepID=UPI0027E38073|nr:patatin family protein [Prevotella sp.]